MTSPKPTMRLSSRNSFMPAAVNFPAPFVSKPVAGTHDGITV